MMKNYKILLSFFLIMISGLGFSQSHSVPSYVTTNGLIGWWGFNGNAQDNSGNGNHGTVNGATLTTDRFGNQNGAYDFDGGNDLISLSNCPTSGSQSFSIFSWINTASSANRKSIISYGSNNLLGGLWLYVEVDSLLHFDLSWNFGPASNVQIENNTWHHVGVVNNAGLIQLFVDGFASGAPQLMSPNILTGGSTIGSSITSNGWFFNGKIDDIGIWNRALTQQEITNLYNSQSGITIPNLTSCHGDTSSVTISHPTISGVANASLRMTYNPDSLTYVGFNSLNPAFNGMTISGGNGSILLDWNTSSNQTIAAGNMVNFRFRVNGSSPVAWDTTQFPCEFSDFNFNAIPQTYVSGSITQNTQSLTWNRNICQGQSFTLGNQSYTSSGTYQGRSFGTGGSCDTLITLNLNVIPTQTILPAVTTCSNQPYSFNGLLLTSSGIYFDTLTNSLGCDSILQLNLTVNPAYNQNQNVVICTGTTFAFGGQNLSSSGTYSHTFTTANGCDSSVQLNLFVAGSVSISSSNNTNGFCPGGSLRIGLVSPIPNVSYQWTKDGSIIAGVNSDSLMVTQIGTYQLTVQASPTCSVISNTLSISILNCNRITGDLKYDNNNQTSLAGVPVHLKTLLGNVVACDTTDSAGVYDMTGYNNGNYVLDANVNYVPGGINSTDALQVTRFFTSLISLSPLRVKAGDVNGNNILNSADALLINRRITGLLSAFSVGGFVNSIPMVNAAGNPLQGNLRVISTGDVNGTYNPLPLAPALVLDTVIGGPGSGTAVVRFASSGSGVFERGICWGTSPNPTVSANKMVVGSGGYGFTQVFSGSMVGNQLYYLRAYARTSTGIFYSNEKTFMPVPGQSCPGVSTAIDIDGNVYQGIQIGNQCWTQSNLKVSKYRNGDNIPTGLSNSAWQNTNSGAYAIYNTTFSPDTNSNNSIFGKLYNHYAVTDSRGLCPTGWHVPSDGEWTILENYLGGTWVAGQALHSTTLQPIPGGWYSPPYTTGATNSSGFTALPGGLRGNDGNFIGLTSGGFWWSSSVSSGSDAWNRYLRFDGSFYRPNNNRTYGYSVRCLKD